MSGFDDLGRIDGLAQPELDRLAARARAALDWRRRAEELRADGEVDGVRATVSGTGSLVDLRIPTPACADGGDALAERVGEAISRARAEVARLVTRSAQDTFGEDSPEAGTVREQWEAGARRRPAVLRDTGDAGPASSTPPRPDTPPPPPQGGGMW
ncbi:hypothetical protein G7075_03040 [Phycicoccus sp. HDW14]|uniref:hypothetical protein n=1 Tax=Phycicoccus sp. HDW14 TaxID=2714941 RepID=UPI00140AD8BE|nr:hypothetical protein [Phycicoccus sp. HDW14]QIM20357.1 hypothetical protein G7075_03040 [Phycicoccus sp. HDW14]